MSVCEYKPLTEAEKAFARFMAWTEEASIEGLRNDLERWCGPLSAGEPEWAEFDKMVAESNG